MRGGGLSCEESFTLMILRGVFGVGGLGGCRGGQGGEEEDGLRMCTHTDPGGCIPL